MGKLCGKRAVVDQVNHFLPDEPRAREYALLAEFAVFEEGNLYVGACALDDGMGADFCRDRFSVIPADEDM